ncbi:MAG TPA: mandelate racemase/muconate lactonizing enzyme family protein [Candidatus Latescibacteria bacterium]|nr:mandelate racemase/muconate lactonizing enzyme family protein [Candidatus Latescibacterota bacterium]HOS65198.1 mandelate racemase/muconate lactonizing enzyme family protein [Candidatus Latescibacterota bacterium]
MLITDVDAFVLAMPHVTDAADGTQDTFLVRIRTNTGVTGWGESDASPLVSLAAYYCPMSHGNIINIRESLLGERVDTPEDIRRLHQKVRRQGLDIEQIDHAYSAADIALWDALGKQLDEPVYHLLGSPIAYPKLPYASVLFADTPQETLERARGLRKLGFRAAKFGWGPMGKRGADFDVDLVAAAREGMGEEAEIMIDAGVAWGTDYETAYARALAFSPFRPTWLEEPLLPDAVDEYGKLKALNPPVPIAAGEGAARFRTAQDILCNGKVDFLQIDVGRIGGLTPAREVAVLTRNRGAIYVNHTFKSHLSLAASFHVFAGESMFRYLEYPAAASDLAKRLVAAPLVPGSDGLVRLPRATGLGVELDMTTAKEYLQPVRIELGGKVLVEINDLA